MVNIHHVAKLAGVSATTAKRAIREPEKLATATLLRVREAIDTLGYEPDQVASALRSGRGTTVGLVIGSIVEPFFAHLTRTIVHAIRDEGYSVIMADNEYRSDLELAHLKTFSGNRIAGLIVRSGYGEPNLAYLRRLRRRGVAIVEVDYHVPESPLAHVMLDNADAVERGVAHLVEHGHRRIAPLGSFHPTINPDERVRAFPVALGRHGLALPEAYVRPVAPVEGDAYDLTRSLMQGASPPTALFALTGTMATGAYRALRDLGLRVPEDVSLMGFDDYPWMGLVTPGIDTLAQPVVRMGEETVRIMFEQIRGGPELPAERVRLRADMLVRGSVRTLA